MKNWSLHEGCVALNAAEEFTRWYLELHGEVLRYACRRVGDSAGEEVAADTFFTLWRRWEVAPHSDRDLLRGWLYVVARHKVLHVYKFLERKHRDISLELDGREIDLQASDSGIDFVERDDACRILRGLTKEQRDAFLLVHVAGHSSKDAAENAGCSPQAIANRLSRVRKAIHLSELHR